MEQDFIPRQHQFHFEQAPTNVSGLATRMMITVDGNVGINTTVPDERLTVNGGIHAHEVKVDSNVPGPDYVFDETYELSSLDSIETFIRQNKHLPEIPSAKEMEENGIKLSEMNMLLLQKIEELTLHMIALKKENREIMEKVEIVQKENEGLKRYLRKNSN